MGNEVMVPDVYVVESMGGGIYIGKSAIPLTPSATSPIVLTDCITDENYLGNCHLIICASWLPDAKGVEFYEEQLKVLLETKEG